MKQNIGGTGTDTGYACLLLVFSSVAQSCPAPHDPMNCSMPGLPVYHQLPESTETHVNWVGDASNHLILCCPLLMPSIFPSIRVFSSKSALRIRWPKFWSFNFSISPSDEYSQLISFRIDRFHLLAVQGTLKSLLQHQGSKTPILFGAQPSLWSNSHICTLFHF